MVIRPITKFDQYQENDREPICSGAAVAMGKPERQVRKALWQQATIKITCYDHSIIACPRHIYMGVILHAHPVHGESHIQRNVDGEVTTLPLLSWLSEKWQRCLKDHKLKSFSRPMRIGDKVRNGKDTVHAFDHKGSVYCVPCGNCNQKLSNTRRKEHINCIKYFHLEKSSLAKHALQWEHGTNWWKTLKIVAFETDFRKKCFIESFFINSTPNVINTKISDLFPQMDKDMYGYI